MGARFIAIRGFKAVDFGDEFVVFNPRSWDAHLLNPAAQLTLELLSQAPCGLPEIAAALSDVLDPDARALAREHANRVLADLRLVGLIEDLEEEPLARR